MSPIKKILLTLTAAGLCIVIFPSWNLWPLAWVALVPLFWVISTTSPKNAFFLGWLFGAVHAMGVGYWVFYALYFHGHAGLPVSLLFMGIVLGAGIGCYFAFFSLGANRMLRSSLGMPVQAMAIAALWTALEYARAHLFSGIPWCLFGHCLYSQLTLIQIADITGVYGISYLIVLTNISIFLAFKAISQSQKGFAVLLLPTLLIGITMSYGHFRLSQNSFHAGSQKPDAVLKDQAVAVIQLSVSQEEKWDKEKWQTILSSLLQLSETALQKGAKLVVWPETTVPFYLEQKIPESITALFTKYHATLLTGGPRYTGSPGDYTFFNSVYQINGGHIINIYNKIHLLPFGEYFPLGFIDVLKVRYAAPRQYSPGNDPVIFTDPVGRFGALVCFEVLFPRLTRNLVNRGADFIVNVSNDAWFGPTSEHFQHFSMAVFRAVECRRPLVRASNTGISGFIDSTGKIIESISPYDEGFRMYRPKFSRRITFYCQYGDVFAFLCIALIAIVGLIPVIRRILFRVKP